MSPRRKVRSPAPAKYPDILGRDNPPLSVRLVSRSAGRWARFSLAGWSDGDNVWLSPRHLRRLAKWCLRAADALDARGRR